jgi:acyl-CoA thioester hydrolase
MAEPVAHRWPVRVYYEDTDVSGVVYHANYLKWFERARTEWLRARGLQQENLLREFGIAFTVANIELDYLRPARLDDALEILTVVSEIRRASLGFAQTLLRGTELLARARVRVACVDARRFRPRAMPAGLVDDAAQG